MQSLIDAVLRLGAAELATEEAACMALVSVRFPQGISCPTCDSTCSRVGAQVTCARKHRFTILVDTALASKTRPRIRALLIAIRMLALSPRSVPARELARDLQVPHVTLWRHLHTLRALLPAPSTERVLASGTASVVRVCSDRSAHPAKILAGASVALERRFTTSTGGRPFRLIGESVRTLLNGTFRGVSARWLPSYLAEVMSRWRERSSAGERGRLVAVFLERMLEARGALHFDDVLRRVDFLPPVPITSTSPFAAG